MIKTAAQNLIGDLQRAAIDSVLNPNNHVWQKSITKIIQTYPSLLTYINTTSPEHLLMSAIRLEQKYLTR